MISARIAVLRPFFAFTYDMAISFAVITEFLFTMRGIVPKTLATVTLNSTISRPTNFPLSPVNRAGAGGELRATYAASRGPVCWDKTAWVSYLCSSRNNSLRHSSKDGGGTLPRGPDWPVSFSGRNLMRNWSL